MRRIIITTIALTLSSLLFAQYSEAKVLDELYQLISVDDQVADQAEAYVHSNWNDTYVAPMIELMLAARSPKKRKRIVDILEEKTGQNIGANPYEWWQWVWTMDPTYPAEYSDFKARLMKNLDSRFSRYFKNRGDNVKIRLDEVLWGGVEQDGIPPLRDPFMLEADEASYMAETDLIFGIVINGEARAYPQRILAWHEMVVDNIGGKRIAGVYCTLCGTVIAYDTEYNGVSHDLGTSGFLYRSNKLMYDKATQSLWNTIEGEPVIGPLVDKGITLNTYPVITSTWREWRQAHPETLVLSLRTGHRRDYSTGAAYRDYYATDELMFPVPLNDRRLANKQEVFIIRSTDYKNDPLAISTKFLKKNNLHQDKVGDEEFVIITDSKGGSRAYKNDGISFKSYKKKVLTDSDGQVWNVHEDYISLDDGTRLERASSHNVFWFAWFNTYPLTRLVK